MSYGFNGFDITNLSNSFPPPPLRVQQSPQQMEITRLNTEINRLTTKIQQLESSKTEQENDQERIMSHNKEVLEMCKNLFMENQKLQENSYDERQRLNACIIDLQSQIGILENKLSEMQVKTIVEFENTSLKQENERLKNENEKISKSNAFWILKIYKFLLSSRLKHKYNTELNRMRDLVMDDYTKTGKVVARTKSILEEYFAT
jgi:chromosome segregation ATPase